MTVIRDPPSDDAGRDVAPCGSRELAGALPSTPQLIVQCSQRTRSMVYCFGALPLDCSKMCIVLPSVETHISMLGKDSDDKRVLAAFLMDPASLSRDTVPLQ